MKKASENASSPEKDSPRRLMAALVRGGRATFGALRIRIVRLLQRRPHRSFRRTYRRDYARSLALPGYWALANEVRKTLIAHKWTFLLLAALYAGLSAALVGLASQSTYDQLSGMLDETGEGIMDGAWGEVGKAGLLVMSGVLGSLNETPTDVQRIIAAILGLMVWLTTVWLLRVIMSGKKPRLRDGLYNAGAPVISTFLVSLFLVVQLLPVALALLALTAASGSGLIDGGVESMVFWVVVALLGVLSLYWLVATFFALIVVTLPGMYPMQAIRTAGDLVIGRRVRIMLRFLWVALLTIVAWFAIMVPIIFFDKWLKSAWGALEWLPLVPVSLLLLASFSVVWVAAYTYIFYRKVVDDDASPA
jgi:hypothetical protein